MNFEFLILNLGGFLNLRFEKTLDLFKKARHASRLFKKRFAKLIFFNQRLKNILRNSKFPRPSPLRGEGGYAYIMVLAAVAVLAILAATAYELVSYQVKHDREAELLFRGLAYERAIRSYYLSNPPGTTPTYPRNLTDLLSDPRFVQKRHLRALYPDPMGTDWSIMKSPDGGIAGVASQSKEKPLKQDHFPPAFSAFTGAQHYSDWIFLYQPGSSTLSNPSTNGSSSSNSNL
jgi:type II secretory pathway pseudopilin PulG